MKIETVDLNRNNIYLVKVAGRLDAAFSAQLEDEIDQLLERTKKIIMDFSSVTYLSSSGLRVLLSVKRETENQGGLVLINLADIVKRIIHVAELDDFLSLADSVDEAIKIIEKKTASSS
ncbi:MAG: anti-sigma factor antagonist [Proteobacteria bacterium]|nr:anti-sigma factor antagonist [Pseudomonadota bacterium]NIS71733.1 anti-sigma factor antagonist [Pseudomonadota bacterium]